MIRIGGVSRAEALAGRTDDGSLSDQQIWNDVLDAALRERDSVGGVVECRIDSVPVGLGEPFFDSVEALVSHAVFSIPGVRGIEFGAGPLPSTNGAGGVNGGISNGNPIVFRVAFKPTSSIGRAQRTYDFSKGMMTTLETPGRHDACFALRTPVIVEAMAALVLADLAAVASR